MPDATSETLERRLRALAADLEADTTLPAFDDVLARAEASPAEPSTSPSGSGRAWLAAAAAAVVVGGAIWGTSGLHDPALPAQTGTTAVGSAASNTTRNTTSGPTPSDTSAPTGSSSGAPLMADERAARAVIDAPMAHTFAVVPGWDQSLAVLWRSCPDTGECTMALAISTPTGTVLRPVVGQIATSGMAAVPDGWVASSGDGTAVHIDLAGTVTPAQIGNTSPDPRLGDAIVSLGKLPPLLWTGAGAPLSPVPRAQDFPMDTACLTADGHAVGAGTTQRVSQQPRATVGRYEGSTDPQTSQWRAGTIEPPGGGSAADYVPTTIVCNGPHALVRFDRRDDAAADYPDTVARHVFAVSHDNGLTWAYLDGGTLGVSDSQGFAITDRGTVLVDTGATSTMVRLAKDAAPVKITTPGCFVPVSQGARLYAHALDSRLGLCRSTDDGQTWVTMPMPGQQQP